MNRSFDDSDDGVLEDEHWPIPANEWVPLIENNGDQFDMADRGIGFLQNLKMDSPEPAISDNVTDDGEDGAENTIGELGMGRVINGMDAETEVRLFKDLYKEYGSDWQGKFEAALTSLMVLAGLAGGTVIGGAEWLALASVAQLAYILARKVT